MQSEIIAAAAVIAIAMGAAFVLYLRPVEAKKKKAYYLDFEEGAVLLLGAPKLEITLASFRKTGSTLTFDVLMRNTGGDKISAASVEIDGKKAVFNGLAQGELKASGLSFLRVNENAELEVAVDGQKTYSSKLQFADLLREFARKGKITVIEPGAKAKQVDEKELRERIVREFESQLGARKTDVPEEVEELNEQEKEVERKFLKRELNSDTFYKLMQDIEKRKIEIAAKKNLKRRN